MTARVLFVVISRIWDGRAAIPKKRPSMQLSQDKMQSAPLGDGRGIRAPASAYGMLSSTALAFVAVLLIGAVDVWSGQELSVAVFYVLVVGSLAWTRGRTAGVVVAIVSAAIGVAADHLTSEPAFELSSSFSHAAVPWWNGAARLIVNLGVGITIAALRETIRTREVLVDELRQALAEVQTLRGLLPICAWCKKIRDEEHEGSWVSVEQYLTQRTSAEFTHGICPECAERHLSKH